MKIIMTNREKYRNIILADYLKLATTGLKLSTTAVSSASLVMEVIRQTNGEEFAGLPDVIETLNGHSLTLRTMSNSIKRELELEGQEPRSIINCEKPEDVSNNIYSAYNYLTHNINDIILSASQMIEYVECEYRKIYEGEENS